MGIFDIFTGDPMKEAAENQRQYLSGLSDKISSGNLSTRDLAAGYLNQGYGQGQGSLGTGYGASTGAVMSGADQAQRYLQQGTGGALAQLAQGRADLQGAQGAYQPLSDLAGQYGKGAGLYANALGINGPEGSAAARAAFQEAPGTEYVRNQGIDALSRKANASGQLVGGNADRDAQNYAANLANQGYNAWLGQLSPYNAMQLQATQGAAQGQANAGQQLANLDVTGANLLQQTGQNQAGVASGQGTTLANLAQQYYGNLAGSQANQGTALANNANAANQATNQAYQAFAQPYANTYKQEGEAEMAGSQNLWGMGLNLAKLAAGGAGGVAGGGGSSFLPSMSFLQNGMSWK